MPRPLVLGNGSLLLCIDSEFVIRDFFYPMVGHPNHLNGHPIRMGVWVDGLFEWCDGPGWERRLGYREGTLVGKTCLSNERLKVRLEVLDAVPPHEPLLARRIQIENQAGGRREFRLFFSHDLRINESDIGDTAFFNPFLDGMVHYKGQTYVLFGGATSEGGLFEYATGIKGFGGMEGTWRDAEDGHLSMNPIAQGSVDSTFSLSIHADAKKSAEAHYWIVCGSTLEELAQHFHRLVQTGVNDEIEEAGRYWRAWSNRPIEGLSDLPASVSSLFTQSLLIMRTQIDDGGAVIAANDSDIMKTNRANYSYMWPRDGAFVSYVLDRVGYQHLSRKFFRFCKKVLPKDRPMLLHKYGPDGSLGASWHPWVVDGKPEIPFQEDESALTIHALWEHYVQHQDLEFMGELYDDFVVPMVEYMLRYRDDRTGLPLPSYDLWEERRGVHTFTVGAVALALKSASKIAQALGDTRSESFAEAGNEIADALEAHLYDEDRGVYYRMARWDDEHRFHPDRTIDASLLNLVNLGVLSADSPRVKSSVDRVQEALWVESPIGGLARYEGDYYFRVSDSYPGNPWLICTLWLAQARLRLVQKAADLEEPLRLIQWAVSRAAETGVLPEQVHPLTGEPLSVSPLTWSHAEYVNTVLDYLAKLKELGR